MIPSEPYIFFGGKGGVGKTTCAVATALCLLEDLKHGEKVLLFSTDPAHSLSDSLETSIGNRITSIDTRGGASLDAWEMDATLALKEFESVHGPVLAEIADRGTLLDKGDINELLNLSLPGLDEVMALFQMSELDRQGGYSRVVVDTAPSGHTARLLQLPAVFDRWLSAMDRMSEKHRYMVAQITRRKSLSSDPVEVFLQDLRLRIERVRDMLYSASHSSFVLVTIPEAMAVAETLRYYENLQTQGMSVTHIIINRLEYNSRSCSFCRRRAQAQKPHLAELGNKLKTLKQHRVPILPVEVRGISRLRDFGSLLWDDATAPKPESKAAARPASLQLTAEPMDIMERKLYIIGGKGGVGKTTTACALSIYLAEQSPDKRFLVFSADPAHSLSDSFAEEVGRFKRGVAGLDNLDGLQIDAISHFEELKRRYRKWIDELFSSLTAGSNWDIQFDREAMQELIALAPPGIDELMALEAISDFLEKRQYTSVILDTAPTGHLIRLLELPEIVLDWVRTRLKLLLKYRQVVTSTSLAEELIRLSKGLKKLLRTMSDPEACEFIPVTIPERMSVSETVRLIQSVQALHVPVQRLVLNNVTAESSRACSFCSVRRQWEVEQIASVRRQFPSLEIRIAAQASKDIRGARALRRFLNDWQVVPKARTYGKGKAQS